MSRRTFGKLTFVGTLGAMAGAGSIGGEGTRPDGLEGGTWFTLEL
jgi:hypothetical protein